MNKYEIMVIIKTSLEKEEKEAMTDMIVDIIKENGGEVDKIDTWGNRKLAYPIQKLHEGYYVVINFSAAADLPKELDRRLKISDKVLRHMIIAEES